MDINGFPLMENKKISLKMELSKNIKSRQYLKSEMGTYVNPSMMRKASMQDPDKFNTVRGEALFQMPHI